MSDYSDEVEALARAKALEKFIELLTSIDRSLKIIAERPLVIEVDESADFDDLENVFKQPVIYVVRSTGEVRKRDSAPTGPVEGMTAEQWEAG